MSATPRLHVAADLSAGETIGIEARTGVLMLLKLPTWRWLPLFQVTWTWESPANFLVALSEADGMQREQVQTFARNMITSIRRRFVIEDCFGLVRMIYRAAQPEHIRVLPWIGRLETSLRLRSLSTGDDLPHPLGQLGGDRVEIRRYVPGDPLRLMLWKIYARTGELMVRTNERSLSPSVRLVAYLVSGRGDEPASAAARVAVERGLLGEDWIFGADGAKKYAREVGSALDLISASRHVDEGEGNGAGLKAFLDSLWGPTRLVLFLPANLGPWLDHVTAALGSSGSSTSAVVVTDRVWLPDTRSPIGLTHLLKLPPPIHPEEEVTTTSAELDQIVTRLRDRGVSLEVLERPTGYAHQPVRTRVA